MGSFQTLLLLHAGAAVGGWLTQTRLDPQGHRRWWNSYCMWGNEQLSQGFQLNYRPLPNLTD